MVTRIVFALMILLATACSSASAPASGSAGGGQEVTTPSGLKYTDEVVGTGKQPQAGQTAIVHYTGWTLDGKKFDSSKDRKQPFQFPLGAGQVIKGWDEGVATMKVGGKRILIVPPQLGYGASGRPPVIPPNATLRFEVELLDVR
jgi:peptidylprolyl isomerase